MNENGLQQTLGIMHCPTCTCHPINTHVQTHTTSLTAISPLNSCYFIPS